MTDPNAKEHRVSETDQTVRVAEDKSIQARFKDLLAHVERRKSDRGYFERWEEQVAEYRREVQEEAERELAEEGK